MSATITVSLLDDLERLAEAARTIADVRRRLTWKVGSQKYESERVQEELQNLSEGFVLEAAVWDLLASIEDGGNGSLDRHAATLSKVIEMVREMDRERAGDPVAS